MREPLSIPEGDLRACLRDQYDLAAVTLEFLPLGLDTRAGLYRVETAQGTPHLLKVKAGPFYEASCLVPRYLADQWIAAVVAPLPTTRGALWARLKEWADWVVLMYPFIEGHRGWNPPMTDEQWKAVGAALRQIHQAAPPPEGVASPRRETFDPAEYRRWVREFEAEQLYAESGSMVERALRERWRQHLPAIHTMLAAMDDLAAALRERSGPYVICHADLHPSNIIRDSAGGVHVIDWDDVMLAPKERDFLFVGEPAAEGSAAGSGASPFFEGYGAREIDWVALTYYRWERIVQDVIACAQNVICRDDLGEETKADEARLFDAVLAPNNTMIVAACTAAAHLPPDLSAPRGAAS